MTQIQNIDKKHIIHPYSIPVASDSPVFEVCMADKTTLTLSSGEVVIDAMSSWWAAIHGYNHPILNEAVKTQVDCFSHVMFGGLTHKPAMTLAKQLVDMTAAPLTKVFFSDSGSVSIEVALKMSLQYWKAIGQPKKKYILTVRGGYHGDTLGTMALCDPQNGMHKAFTLPESQVIFCNKPSPAYGSRWNSHHLSHIANVLTDRHEEIAAIILEPIVQNAGGLYFYSPDYLENLKQLCDRHNVLLILDEIATGFGRTGKMFAYEHANISPDILCLGKALTGGYISLAATLCTEKIAIGIASSGQPFMHGPTFMGNPLACSVASASINLLSSYDLTPLIGRIANDLNHGLKICKDLPIVIDVRVLGGIGVVEVQQSIDMLKVQALTLENKVWIRPLFNIIYVVPPYISSPSDIATICTAIYNALSKLS